jgi:2-polyprenyl-3-methyl-5-hydroxy-6-metoxy-1,4-benzoquinol methylase
MYLRLRYDSPPGEHGVRMRRNEREPRFDAAFYARYYGDPATRVADVTDMACLAGLIAAATRHAGIRVRRILDAGCGIGLLREPLLRHFPQARYTGLEHSEYLCARYGWTRASIAEYAAREPFDLVVCHDVLQYLDDATAAKAIARLRPLARGTLYFSALTRADWRRTADQSRTDRNVHLRTADWYRTRLRRGFRHLGFGVHLVRDLAPVEWQLEAPWR